MEKNQASIQDYKDAVKKYINDLRSLPEEESRARAQENLRLMGILDNTGKVKSQIANGDFFGW